MIPAVIYGVKSSPDEKESVDDQHRIVREAIERETDREVVGVFGEANQSGYRKERGPELERAIRAACDAATDDVAAELWVFHSSRLSRGDGRKGRRGLGKIVHDLLYENVVVRSVSDPDMVSPTMAGIAGKANHEYSAALSSHTTRGIHKRQREGKPFGAIPTGYRAEPVMGPDGKVVVLGGRVVTERVKDPDGVRIMECMWSAAEAGKSSTEIARTLNTAGFRTPPRADRPNGNLWTRETVRQALQRRLYTGDDGYPQMIDPDRWLSIQSLLSDSTPAAQQRRRGGRPLMTDGFLLRGLAFCGHCGEPVHVRSTKGGGYYTCRAKRRGTGQCDARSIPARLLDQRVLPHLDMFIVSVEDWIADQLATRNDERAARRRGLDIAQAALARLDEEREKLLAKVREYVAADQDTRADAVLAAVEQVDAERGTREQEVADLEARLAEWQTTPSVDQALDYYRELSDAIKGRTSGSQTVGELRATLSTIVGGVWVKFDGKILDATFTLRDLDHHPWASDGVREFADFSRKLGEPDHRWMLDPTGWLNEKLDQYRGDGDGRTWPRPMDGGGPGGTFPDGGQPPTKPRSSRSSGAGGCSPPPS
jgi:DNA invertase Pin-like site-specific DNA recombinase